MYGTLGGSLVLTLTSNPLFSVSQQLKDGVRMLQMQAHELNGGIQLCHTACVSTLVSKQIVRGPLIDAPIIVPQ